MLSAVTIPEKAALFKSAKFPVQDATPAPMVPIVPSVPSIQSVGMFSVGRGARFDQEADLALLGFRRCHQLADVFK